jgi:hypothetical protein
LNAAYLFGTAGNLSTALGAGWSVEDTFAWAIGNESILALPLRGDDQPYMLRFNVHPALFPPRITRQRLMIRAGKTVIGSFEVTARDSVAMALPVGLTTGLTRLELTLIHPDAARPRDHLPVDDPRRLALCFHSASLGPADTDHRISDAASLAGGVRQRSPVPSDQIRLEPVHGVIAGGATARRICQVIGKLPSLRGRFGLRFFDLSQGFDRAVQSLPPETLDTMQCCWTELNAVTSATRDRVREAINPECAIHTFYAPIIRSLWPFQGPDERGVVEPGRYTPSRYPYGDRLAQVLAGMNMPDDLLYLMYEASVEREPLDLDEIFANDLRRWRAEGRKSDMKLADFIEHHVETSRIFVAPDRVGPILLREMVDQVLDRTRVCEIADPTALAAELDALLDGYVGWQEELPVHARVASHFRLPWWSPELNYRWMNNKRTHREYILDYIRWVQWRP